MTQQHIVIIGAGMAGSVLAHKLAKVAKVTVVELAKGPEFPPILQDVGYPGKTDPMLSAGPGGTSQTWHNGLIEIASPHFNNWPFREEELFQYYSEAYEILGCVTRAQAHAAGEMLRDEMKAAGVPEKLMGTPLCYPVARRNLWQTLCRNNPNISLYYGHVTQLVQEENHVRAVLLQTPEGEQILTGDVFIVSAGGLGTPCLLQSLTPPKEGEGVANAGYHYEDHPFAFVGEIQLGNALYKLWNWHIPHLPATMRIPFVTHTPDGTPVSFYLRPAAMWWRQERRQSLTSVLNQVRNHPWRLGGYLKLLGSWDDVLDILSFKFGINVPTDRYSLFMVAGQPPQEHQAVRRTEDGGMVRDWRLTPAFLAGVDKAIDSLVEALGPLVGDFHKYPGWEERLQSSAHHSGTARLASEPTDGVCTPNNRVYGFENLYACDGSSIPESGYANTGITITALALRLAKHLMKGKETA